MEGGGKDFGVGRRVYSVVRFILVCERHVEAGEVTGGNIYGQRKGRIVQGCKMKEGLCCGSEASGKHGEDAHEYGAHSLSQ